MVPFTKSFFDYNNITHLLTPWSRVLLEKLTGPQLLKKFPESYGTSRFISTFTKSHLPNLRQINPAHALPSHFLKIHLNSITPIYVWVSQVVAYSKVSPPNPSMHLTSSPYVLHAPPISFFSV